MFFILYNRTPWQQNNIFHVVVNLYISDQSVCILRGATTNLNIAYADMCVYLADFGPIIATSKINIFYRLHKRIHNLFKIGEIINPNEDNIQVYFCAMNGQFYC